jgi:predicted kinase
MTFVVMFRGIPGSGKTTIARKLATPETVRLSRDDLRAMLTGSDQKTVLSAGMERVITHALRILASRALDDGKHVIVDGTNLHPRDESEWRLLAAAHGALFEVYDLSGVPLEVCLARNAARADSVPEHVVRKMHARLTA